MHLFGRTPFWAQPPIPSKHIGQLVAHGVAARGAADGLGMVRTGWRLWTVAGIHVNGAAELLHDGYLLWAPGAASLDQAALLAAWFDRLAYIAPPIAPDADLRAVEPGHLAFARASYGSRAFAGAELLRIGVTGLRPGITDDVHRALAETHAAFVPDRRAPTPDGTARPRQASQARPLSQEPPPPPVGRPTLAAPPPAAGPALHAAPPPAGPPVHAAPPRNSLPPRPNRRPPAAATRQGAPAAPPATPATPPPAQPGKVDYVRRPKSPPDEGGR